MSTSMINKDDLAGLRDYQSFLTTLPQTVDTFKQGLGHVFFKDPALNHVFLQASADAKLWSTDFERLHSQTQELRQFISGLTHFSRSTTAYVARLAIDEQDASITHPEHARVLMSSTEHLQPQARNVYLTIQRYRDELYQYSQRVDRTLEVASSIRTSVYNIIPRVVDFMNAPTRPGSRPIFAIGRAAFPGQVIQVDWLKQISHANQAQSLSAQNNVMRIKKEYAQYSCAATHMRDYCDHLSRLLMEARDQLNPVGPTISLDTLSLALSLMSSPLNQAQALCQQMNDASRGK